MKKYLAIAFLFFAVSSVLYAQDKDSHQGHNHDHDHYAEDHSADSTHTMQAQIPGNRIKADTAEIHLPNIYAWKLSPRLGERTFVPRDTLVANFHQSMLVDGQGVAMGYLGNIGSPAQSKIFFDRPEASRFTFLDAMYLWRKNPEDHYFLNTKVPYTNIKYQTGGGGDRAEQRFQSELSMNMNKKVNVGFDFDYVYSRGFYDQLSNKQLSYDFYASYIGDRYKMHAFFHNNNFTNIENGGIVDSTYILNPNAESISSTLQGNTRNIPVRMQGTRNKMRGRHVYITNRYDLGDHTEEYAVNDSITARRKKENYIPLASAILTTHYTDQRRRIESESNNIGDLYYPYLIDGNISTKAKYQELLNDYMSYYSFKNTFALAMNEGFRSWTKFGLTAFIEYDMRRFSLPGELPGLHDRHNEDALTIGGVLSKEKGKYLKYKASAESDILNGDFKATGSITSLLSIGGKNLAVTANAHIKNTSPSFFHNHFSSKYWNWNKDFSHIRSVYIGGEIKLPELSFSKTRISGGVETINNHIYYGTDRLPYQNSKDVQVVSLRLDQDLNYGIFHWDNQIVYQMTSDDKVIPLPDLSIYSNMYLQTKIAKVLTVQLGADAHFHTEYYMPGYDPLTMQFYNQRNSKWGNFPISTVYANMHLKYTRFFIMMYNVLDGIGNAQSFSLYRYPVNPRVLKLGISWQFNN